MANFYLLLCRSQMETTTPATTELADIQATSKGKMVESSDAAQITMIRELQPTSYDKMLEVRVHRKWISISYAKKGDTGTSPKKTETAYCCILIDEEVCQN